MQAVALWVSWIFTVVGVTLFVRMVLRIVNVIRMGQPLTRNDQPGARLTHTFREVFLHTRMLQFTKVGVIHWFIMMGFGLLFFTLVTAYGQLANPYFYLPLIGHFPPYEWATELLAWAMFLGILPLMWIRYTAPKERTRGVAGRFFGSTMWQGYFVEWVILLVAICILLLRFFEYALADGSALHYPLTFLGGQLFERLPEEALKNLIWLVAMTKIVVSMTWMMVLGRHATMGVAWHRFTAPFNIFFKREVSGNTALGAAMPLMVADTPLTLASLDDLDEDTALGVGKAEDFTWKARLDFASCTECGRCQSQCPAWNTDKPLSPKLLMTELRDHTYARAGGGESERPLIADPTAYGVIDPDVLWSCTTCGACVQECPVDIEHVDHILQMRRAQVLVDADFPSELNGLYRGLESKGNPWNMPQSGRLDWAKGLPFEVPVVGDTIESLDDVDWLMWVGCAGAFEDRAKKTTQAVAELLHIAGVSFGVLGQAETCTGDPARRSGNELVYLQLAAENVATLREYHVKRVVASCAHCLNALKNEYRQLGIELEVVHHTQLLNRLVRDKKLVPAHGAAGVAAGSRRPITYHDPCYLGRHNQVYEPPRELLSIMPDVELREMERHAERSFCCGAGGARMWMEENTGERINANRTAEALGTGAQTIAVGCPFCRVMISDGVTAAQASGEADPQVEVLDVAQMLLAAIKGEPSAEAEPASPPLVQTPGGPADTETDTSAAATREQPTSAISHATPHPAKEPESTKSSDSGSLFDLPTTEKPKEAGGSLFDL
jgi:Fe-S oxidoreductase